MSIAYILLTHAHLDHITGVGRAKEAFGVPVGLHRDDNFLYEAVVQQGMAFGFRVSRQPPVDFFYEGAGPWRFGEHAAWVHHTPGHCPGGVCLAVGRDGSSERTLFVGDTLFAGSIGRTDLPGGDLADAAAIDSRGAVRFSRRDVGLSGPRRADDDRTGEADESAS